jgi:hypothetical protein
MPAAFGPWVWLGATVSMLVWGVGSQAIDIARKLQPPQSMALQGGEFENAEFWANHGNTIRDAWKEFAQVRASKIMKGIAVPQADLICMFILLISDPQAELILQSTSSLPGPFVV